MRKDTGHQYKRSLEREVSWAWVWSWAVGGGALEMRTQRRSRFGGGFEFNVGQNLLEVP